MYFLPKLIPQVPFPFVHKLFSNPHCILLSSKLRSVNSQFWDHVTNHFAMWSDEMASRKRASLSVSDSSSSDGAPACKRRMLLAKSVTKLKLERGLWVMRFPMIILCSLIYLGGGIVSCECFCLPVGHHCSLGLPWAVLDVPYVHDTVNMS